MIQLPIQTYCRIKPPQYPGYEEVTYSIEEGETTTRMIVDNQVFFFDSVFGPSTSNTTIFHQVLLPLITHMFGGINATLLAYGQTGGGKTYTVSAMIGKTLEYVMSRPEREEVWLSYLQLYSERCYDLLNSNKEVSLKSGMFDVTTLDQTHGLTTKKLTSLDEAMSYIALGNENKVTAVTRMNASSSRSHSICTLYLPHLHSKLHLVDLAGSEQLFRLTDDHLLRNEAKKINLSLHYLEQVMIALEEPQRHHIPYRNSTLTSLLRDSLGGNGVTSMIAVVSMERGNQHQTLATLKFAQRSLRVKNFLYGNRNKNNTHHGDDTSRPIIHNIHYRTPQESKAYKKEIEKLKQKIKLRDKEIGVLLEMLTTREMGNADKSGYIFEDKSSYSLDEKVMFTDIDAMFRQFEEDSFILNNIHEGTSEERLGSEASAESKTNLMMKTFPNVSNKIPKERPNTTTTGYSGDFSNDHLVSIHNNPKSDQSNRLSNDTYRERNKADDKQEAGRFIFSKPIRQPTNDVILNNHNNFANSIDPLEKIPNMSSRHDRKYRNDQSSQSRHMESPVYNSLNIPSHQYDGRGIPNTTTSSVDMEDIHTGIERTTKSILRNTDTPKTKLEVPKFHVAFADLGTTANRALKKTCLETDRMCVNEQNQQTESANDVKNNIDYKSNIQYERSPASKKNTDANLVIAKRKPPSNKQEHMKRQYKNDQRHNEIKVALDNRQSSVDLGDKEIKRAEVKVENTDTVEKDSNDSMNATDPSIVENIEQYLTGDPIIDEEIIQFYARRGIVVKPNNKHK